ncbi:MAG: flagellar hook-associated protein FlgL [Ignavibacteriales bacterium]|nr:flagellar hook-associated protein FlgL [Ignavibacteriales bacterium]
MIYTRVTNRLMSDSVINNLLTNRTKLNNLHEQVSTGKKVSRPSDDPTSVLSILSDNVTLNQMNNYKKNIDSAKSELEVTDRVLLSAVDAIHRARELTVQAANVTSGSSELSAINYEIKQILGSLKDLSNTQFGDKYLFGGLVTEEAPFVNTGVDNQVQYTGTPSTGDYERKIEVSKGVTIAVNLAGDSIFGQYYESDLGPPPVMTGSGIFQTMATLIQELETDPPNYNNIRGKLDDFDKDLKVFLDSQAKLGGTIARLDMIKNKIDEDIITYTKRKSGLEDIDLAKVISDIKFQETSA